MAKKPTPKQPAPAPVVVRRLFTRQEWIAAGLAFLVSGLTYFYFMTPEVTLQDSGELVTGAFNFGVPHPTGYPLWAFMSWVWRHLVPFGNPAWRICLFSVVTGAALVGIMTLLMSRSILMLLRNSPWDETIDEPLKEWLSLAVATASAMLFAFNRGVWLWASVPEMRVLNVFSFIVTTCVFFAWMMRPEKHRYLYATILLFSLSIANHQTIVVMALPFLVGAFVVGQMAERNAGASRFSGFLELVFALLIGWVAVVTVNAWLLTSGPNDSLFAQQVKLFFLAGPHTAPMPVILMGGGGAAALLLFGSKAGWLSWKRASWCAGLFLLGCSFYLYMPVAASTNPPMNWGYCATKQGFLHSITRGQYEQLHMSMPWTKGFWIQVWLFTAALINQYSWPVGVFALVTVGVAIRFWGKLRVRGRQWLIYMGVAFLTTCFGLLMIINPGLDKTQQEINLKFFAPAHGFFAMLIGYGFALATAWGLVHFGGRIQAKLLAAATSLVFIITGILNLLQFFSWVSFRPEIESCIAFVLIVSFLLATLSVMVAFPSFARVSSWALVALAIIPFRTNWATCEQRGHDFGYQFGYRMFNPGGEYPPMDKDAFLFGGTDPGRFVPTYMIFSESRAAGRDKFRDPNFDRRDVYIVTQNALADSTYMSYIRDHYDYSRPNPTNAATLAKFDPWERAVFRWGWHHLYRDWMYPVEPIWIPTEQDSQHAFQEYVADVQARRARGEPMDPDEAVNVEGGRVSVRGVKGVMNINAILCRWIHERNKAKHTFYIEESYVIQWMFPYLEPFGIIMKINREPLPSPQENPAVWSQIFGRDRAYWDKLVAEFTARAEFWRDNDARKTFSKLRSAIGGIYAFRKMHAEAEYAFRQSLQLCPDSPEANFRLAQLLIEIGKAGEAIAILEGYQKLDPLNAKIGGAIQQIRNIQQQTSSVQQLEQMAAAQPRNAQVVVQLAQTYAHLQQFDRITPLLDKFTAQPDLPAGDMLQVAQCYLSFNQPQLALRTIGQAVQRHPQESEPRYALAIVAGAMGSTNDAIASLRAAIELNPALRDRVRRDQQLNPLRNDPRFQDLVNPTPR